MLLQTSDNLEIRRISASYAEHGSKFMASRDDFEQANQRAKVRARITSHFRTAHGRRCGAGFSRDLVWWTLRQAG